MSITPNPDANFTPTLMGYTGQGAFRFWCQTVLPLVYDDSLSYYELLNKVVTYLNNAIKDVKAVEDNVGMLNTAYVQLQNYVNTYFDSLDVEVEINNKLNAMAADGTLSDLISPFVPTSVTEWLNENITPTTPPIDKTLTVSDAAADAKVVGDRVFALSDDYFFDLSQIDFTDNTYIKSDGTVASSTSMKLSDYIPVDDYVDSVTVNRVIYTQGGTTPYPQNYMVFWYDSDYEYLGYGSNTRSDDKLTSVKPAEAKYLRFNAGMYQVYSFLRPNFSGTLKYTPKTYAKLVTTNAELEAVTGGTKDANDLPSNSIIYITSTAATNLVHSPLVHNSRNGYYITLMYNAADVLGSGAMQIFLCHAGGIATRTCKNNVWGDWSVCPDEAIVGRAITEKTLTKQGGLITTLAGLEAITTDGTADADTLPSNSFVFVGSNIPEFDNCATIRNHRGGEYITFDNPGRVDGSGKVQLFISNYGDLAIRGCVNAVWRAWSNISTQTPVYTVGPTRTNKSITKLFLDLANDEQEKYIYIEGGVYDIYREYCDLVSEGLITAPPNDADTNDFALWSVFVPANTKVVGLGQVTLLWDAPTDISAVVAPNYSSASPYAVGDWCTYDGTKYVCKVQIKTGEEWNADHWATVPAITVKESQIWSPINTAASCELENLTIKGHNCRYCLHDESRNTKTNIRHVYNNLRLYKYQADTGFGFGQVVGSGFSNGSIYKFKNCYIENFETGKSTNYCVGGHTLGTPTGVSYLGSDIEYENCILRSAYLYCARFQTGSAQSDGDKRYAVRFVNCNVDKDIWLNKANANSTQLFDVLLLNSGNPGFTIDVGENNNPYPPTVINTFALAE